MLTANRLPVIADEAVGLVVNIDRAVIDDDPFRDRCQDGSSFFRVVAGRDDVAEDLGGLLRRDGQRPDVGLRFSFQSRHGPLELVDLQVQLAQPRPEFLDSRRVLAAFLDHFEQLASPPLGAAQFQQQRRAPARSVLHPVASRVVETVKHALDHLHRQHVVEKLLGHPCVERVGAERRQPAAHALQVVVTAVVAVHDATTALSCADLQRAVAAAAAEQPREHMLAPDSIMSHYEPHRLDLEGRALWHLELLGCFEPSDAVAPWEPPAEQANDWDEDDWDDGYACSHCGGLGFDQVEDPFWDECDEHGWGPCTSCRGTGQRAHQWVF